uniref:Uncharacterized protein n=1 Tax=Arundo donax TaxID=35708 RepID=A0A0A9A626_ARUDO
MCQRGIRKKKEEEENGSLVSPEQS